MCNRHNLVLLLLHFNINFITYNAKLKSTLNLINILLNNSKYSIVQLWFNNDLDDIILVIY